MAFGRHGDGGALVKSALRRAVGVTPMQHKTVVPQDDIPNLPLMFIGKLWARRELPQSLQKGPRCFGLHPHDPCHGPRIEVQGLAASDRVHLDERMRDRWRLFPHVVCERPCPLFITSRPPPEVIEYG